MVLVGNPELYERSKAAITVAEEPKAKILTKHALNAIREDFKIIKVLVDIVLHAFYVAISAMEQDLVSPIVVVEKDTKDHPTIFAIHAIVEKIKIHAVPIHEINDQALIEAEKANEVLANSAVVHFTFLVKDAVVFQEAFNVS